MKKGIRSLILITCLLLALSTNIVAFAASNDIQQENGLPQKIADIVSGSNKIYASGVPIEHQMNTDTGVVTPQFVSGGVDHTHQYIAASALSILYNDLGSSLMNDNQNVTVLMSNADWPDVFGNETDYVTFAGHFYDPDSGTNWLGLTSPTAKTRAVSYFNSAVASYRAGNISDAFMYLGRGAHYVSDANEPHHASNLTAINSNHTEFEEYVDAHRTSYYIIGNTLTSDIYQTAENSSVDNLVYSAAKKAKALAGIAQQTSTYPAAGNSSIQNAITTVAQYLYKFGETVGIY